MKIWCAKARMFREACELGGDHEAHMPVYYLGSRNLAL